MKCICRCFVLILPIRMVPSPVVRSTEKFPTESLYFRIHRDGDPEGKWQTPEVVASGRFVADDHINLAVSDDGHIFAVTRTSVDDTTEPIEGPTEAQFILNVRSPEGTGSSMTWLKCHLYLRLARHPDGKAPSHPGQAQGRLCSHERRSDATF